MAEAGDARAQVAVGSLYTLGERGVARDDDEALRWYRMAAAQGYAKGEYLVGHFYALGRSVARDPVEAARWYRRAADRGYVRAQYWLGQIHDRGEGVPQDYAEAARWYRLAAEQGLRQGAIQPRCCLRRW